MTSGWSGCSPRKASGRGRVTTRSWSRRSRGRAQASRGGSRTRPGRRSAELLAVEATGDILGTVGVFLSGAGSILTALGAIHYERRRGEKICRERLEAFREGMRVRDELEK
jgi:hypothetical protein